MAPVSGYVRAILRVHADWIPEPRRRSDRLARIRNGPRRKGNAMKCLTLSLCTLAAFLTPASAEIIQECQWLSDHYPKYYVTKRANVRDAPNKLGKILATLPSGSIVYTNEKSRTVAHNPDKWYILLATKSLPPFSGCSGGYIHPSLVSKTQPSTQTRASAGRGRIGLWGAIVVFEDRSRSVHGVGWDYRTAEEALKRAQDECGYCVFENGGRGMVVVFSTSAKPNWNPS